jgi:heme-binding NEAT domain protein
MATPATDTKSVETPQTNSSTAGAASPQGNGTDAASVVSSHVVSNFIKLTDGSRTRADAVATVSRKGNKLFLKDSNGDLLIMLEFEYEEDAETEMVLVNDQLDRFEATHNSRMVARSSHSGKRDARQR